MTSFSLEIQIDQAGLQSISTAGMSVALLQPQSMANYQIVALLPASTGTIYVTWTDAISVYTSSYSLQAYGTLQINSHVPALSGQKFTFDGTFITPSGTTSLPQTIQLTNASGASITSGVATTFQVNQQSQGLAITTASSLLNNGQGSFQISNQVMLTLLGGAQVGMALPTQVFPGSQTKFSPFISFYQVTVQRPLTLDFSAATPSQTVHFDDQASMFVVGSLPH